MSRTKSLNAGNSILMTPRKCKDLNQLLTIFNEKHDDVNESRNFMILQMNTDFNTDILKNYLDKLITDKYVEQTSLDSDELFLDYSHNYVLTELGMNFLHFGGYEPQKPKSTSEVKKEKRKEFVNTTKYFKAWWFWLGVTIAIYWVLYGFLLGVVEFDFHQWIKSLF